MAISIHAPAQGATIWSSLVFRSSPDFNPRSRTGSDTPPSRERQAVGTISIHAPAQGATALGSV